MFYTGVVEDRLSDPLKLGRCKVRIFGLHSPSKVELPTEDLPWAAVMQPVNSAATSGIGISPTGLVEGAFVIVMFRDEHKQQPIIIGSVAGIPSAHPDQPIKEVATSESTVWTTGSGAVLLSGSGIPITSGGVVKTVPKEIKKPTTDLVPSEDCYNIIREEEKLSSLVAGKNKFVNYKASLSLANSTPLYPYTDTVGKWTIGWGSTFLKDNTAVNENTRLTKEEADSLFIYKVNNEFAAGVRRNLKAPVTQSMFDALVSISYNTGVSGLANSEVMSAVNTTEYEQAASLILLFKTNNGSLSKRRSLEKALFIKDGFPAKDMSKLGEPPDEAAKTPDDATKNPVVKVKPPVVEQPQTARRTEGFRDPNGVYPTIVDEPDTHRLIRHEKIDQTIVFSKEAARAKNITTGGDFSWSQPKVPYNASYPFNHARVTESGHVQEFDDTKGSERIHTYHRSGTYEEIDRNGTRVNRIVGDDFEILERNGHVLIKGSLNITVLGNSNIRVENNSNIDVLGDVNMTVGGNMNTGVTGDYKLNCGGSFSVDAALFDINGGSALGVQKGKGSAAGVPTFSELTTPSRHDSEIGYYETPEEGDPTEYNKALIKKDAIEETTPVKKEEVKPVEKKPEPIVKDCTMIPESGPIDRGFKLSKNFTLGMLDKHNALSNPNAQGLTKAQVVCNLKMLAENCLEPIIKLYPSAILTSGYRQFIPQGGSKTSDHLLGCAADIVINGFNREKHYAAIQEIAKVLPAWTQLILEYKGSSTVWIHVSYVEKRGLRMETFTMVDGRTYKPFGKFSLIG